MRALVPVLKVVHVDPEGEVGQEAHQEGLEKALGQVVDVVTLEGDGDLDRRSSPGG